MSNEKLVCPICGEPTYLVMGKNPRKDRLCGKHSTMLYHKKIEQCPDCQAWHNTGDICECKKPAQKPISKKIALDDDLPNWLKPKKENTEKEQPKESTSDLTCIICGEPSSGKHFCLKCYKLFSKKVLYIQVKKCTEFTKLDAEYESDFTCEDGHLVKSPYEKIIDDYLYREGIKHAYEKKIDIDETHDITPDFFIPEYNGIKNIYVEFWGYGEENVEYTRRKEYKTNLYPTLVAKENISVVYLNKKDVETDNFKKKIKYAKQGEIKE